MKRKNAAAYAVDHYAAADRMEAEAASQVRTALVLLDLARLYRERGDVFAQAEGPPAERLIALVG